MSIQFFNEDVKVPFLNLDAIRKVFKQAVRTKKSKLGDINFIFCSDAYLLQLNKKFLNHNYFTDVITFDYSEEVTISGDVYISTNRVKQNSVTYGQLYENELFRVISHGLLHLLKYNDKEDSEIEIMRAMESELIKKIVSASNR